MRTKSKWNTAMTTLEWVRHHKARTCLVAIAVANALYFFWCAAVDQPTSAFAKLLVPFILLSSVYLKRVESRNEG